MLKNVGMRTQILRWNLKDFTLKAGETIDITKFGVTDPKHVSNLEDRFIAKFKGELARVTEGEASNASDASESKPEEKPAKEGSDAGSATDESAASGGEGTADGGKKKKKKK